MTMTAEQLAQQYDLLIANGQLTADTLIALSENEIDSDYFAVTSTNEARGTEVECELSITEFALRASENVRALLDELERKDKRIAELEAISSAAEKLVRCKGRYHSEQNYRTLAALFGVTTPDLPPLESEARTVTVKLPESPGPMSLGAKTVYCGIVADVVASFQEACAAAGINLTVEG